MPNSDTFSVAPIGEFVRRYLAGSRISVDPFARNKRWATYTNDINPGTLAECHLDASLFLATLSAIGVHADVMILDPPYSPRQITECYAAAGLKAGMRDTQSSYYTRIKAAAAVLAPDATVLSFGWNSVGMGKKYGFEPVEIQLVCHGGAHNDTICMAERRA